MAIDNKVLTRRLMEEVWNQGKLEVIDELLDPAYEGHDPLLGPLSRDAFRSSVKGYRAAFPDLRFEVQAVLVDGNYVTTRWIARGTHLGPLLGTPSTGKVAKVTGIDVAEVRLGRIVSDYAEWDALGLFRQLGLEGVTVPLAVRKPAQETRTT